MANLKAKSPAPLVPTFLGQREPASASAGAGTVYLASNAILRNQSGGTGGSAEISNPAFSYNRGGARLGQRLTIHFESRNCGKEWAFSSSRCSQEPLLTPVFLEKCDLRVGMCLTYEKRGLCEVYNRTESRGPFFKKLRQHFKDLTGRPPVRQGVDFVATQSVFHLSKKAGNPVTEDGPHLGDCITLPGV